MKLKILAIMNGNAQYKTADVPKKTHANNSMMRNERLILCGFLICSKIKGKRRMIRKNVPINPVTSAVFTTIFFLIILICNFTENCIKFFKTFLKKY